MYKDTYLLGSWWREILYVIPKRERERERERERDGEMERKEEREYGDGEEKARWR